MKTTIDIPEPLYKKAKIRAVERGTTMRGLVLEALERVLESAPEPDGGTFLERRRLVPEYRKAMEAGAFRGGTDSADIISEDRSSRDDSLL